MVLRKDVGKTRPGGGEEGGARRGKRGQNRLVLKRTIGRSAEKQPPSRGTDEVS